MYWEKEIRFKLTTRRIFGSIVAAMSVLNLAVVGAVFNASSQSAPEPEATFLTSTPTQETLTRIFPTNTQDVPAPGPEFTSVFVNTASPTLTSPSTPTGTSTTVPAATICVKRSYWPVYQVQAGDNLYAIAQVTGSTVSELMLANCLPDTRIYPGQLLYVPRLPNYTFTPTHMPSFTSTNMPGITPTDTPTPTPTDTPTATSTETPTATQTPTNTPTATQTNTFTPTPLNGLSCLEFTDLKLGTSYKVGQSFSSSGVKIAVEPFMAANGVLINDGFASVTSQGAAGGYNNELGINNVNLYFSFGNLLDGLSILFGEYGGNLNIDINGDFVNFANFVDIDGRVIGGVKISVLNGYGNDKGFLNLSGAINSFAVGGQELWIDNLCPKVNGGL